MGHYIFSLIITMVVVIGTVANDVNASEKVLQQQGEQSAYALMKAVDDRYVGRTRTRLSTLVLIDKNNKRNQRTIEEVSKTYADVKKSISFITHPARIQGTGFLSFDWDALARANESWLYLPKLRKVTRLSTSNRRDYFLGSDFSYGDLEGIEVQDFDYQYAANKISKDGLIIVDAVPAAKNSAEVISKYGYKKITYWVDDKRKMLIRAKFWLEDSGWIKYYKASDIQDYSGVWVATKEQMVLTKQNKKVHSTVFSVETIEINKVVDDGVFTFYGLEKGQL